MLNSALDFYKSRININLGQDLILQEREMEMITKEMVVRSLQEICKAWNSGDVDSLIGHYASDVHVFGSKFNIRGKEQLRAYFEKWFSGDLRAVMTEELKHFTISNGEVEAIISWVGEYSSSGVRIGNSTLVYKIEEGKPVIASEDVFIYFDTASRQ